jgi:hypothetical protein
MQIKALQINADNPKPIKKIVKTIKKSNVITGRTEYKYAGLIS